MAIVHQGALTSGIRGKVGDLVFQMVNGVQVVRQMPPSIQDPNTPLQQIMRSALTQAMQEWKGLSVEERAKWEFQAALRGRKNTHRVARRVESEIKPLDATLYDGHNAVVVQKCREADYNRTGGDLGPANIGLQEPPPYTKTKNRPPHHVVILLAVGSLGAAWNLLNPLVDYDGLWWFYSNAGLITSGSGARVWVQPPYPIHKQRIAGSREPHANPWGSYVSQPFYYHMWAWKCQVKALTIRIVEPAPWAGVATVNIPHVWKSQLDYLDAEFRDSKGSAVVKFNLPAGLAEGLWQVWPTFEDLLGAEDAGAFEHPEAFKP